MKVFNSGAKWDVVGQNSRLVNKVSTTPVNEVIYYSSLYRHGVDKKRRLQIPAKWLPTSGAVEFAVILWPKYSEGLCLRVLPPNEMVKLMATIDAMPNTDSQKTILKRVIGSQSEHIEVDAAGRICLPEEMAKATGLKDKAVLVGLLDQFEIWNPEAYAKVQTADEVMAAEAFKRMS